MQNKSILLIIIELVLRRKTQDHYDSIIWVHHNLWKNNGIKSSKEPIEV